MASLALAMGNSSVLAFTPWRAGDGADAGDQREGVNADRRRRNSDKAQGSGRPQGLQIDTPVLVLTDGAEDKIQGAEDFLHGLGLPGVDKIVRAEGPRLFFLGGGGGEGGNLREEGLMPWVRRGL